jgi:hypothetical protein
MSNETEFEELKELFADVYEAALIDKNNVICKFCENDLGKFSMNIGKDVKRLGIKRDFITNKPLYVRLCLDCVCDYMVVLNMGLDLQKKNKKLIK